MRQQKIITYVKGNGKRTTCTMTEYQINILDGIAEFLSLTRNQYLRLVTSDMPEGMNASAYIRDQMFESMKGVEI